MTHSEIKELIQLSFIDEISDDEKLIIENHLLECDECNKEYTEQKRLLNLYSTNKPAKVNEKQLLMARVELLNNLSKIKNRKSTFQKIKELFEESFLYEHRFAYGSASSLIIGLLVGYSVFSFSPQNNNNSVTNVVDVSNIKNNDFEISNVSFISTNPTTGEIELGFEAVKKVYYKGNFNEEKTKKLLAMALTKSNNDGVKIKSINTITSQDEKKYIEDEKIKEALINTVKLDNNPGVRREALQTLTKFKFDGKIQEALLFVLTKDTNSGLRIAAINVLVQMKEEGFKIDEKTKSVLSEQVANDNNQFIRIKAASILKESI